MLEKVVRKAQRGNKEAFNQLIVMHKDDLYRFAKSKLGKNEEDICDVVQETIVTAYSSIGKLKKRGSFKKWLLKILDNKCKDFFRDKYTHEEVSYESNECENYIVDSHIDSTLEFNDLMKGLNKKERKIILLYYEYNYNCNEIAKILDMNPNTVRSKLSRAREKILKNDKGELKV